MKIIKKKILTSKLFVIIVALLLISIHFISNTFADYNAICEEVDYEYPYEKLDYHYIYNITENLSNIIFMQYAEDQGEIARGRAFGTKGEHNASEILEKEMENLGLWTWRENISNIPENPELADIASAFWINDYKIIIENVSSGINKTVDGYISPTWKGPRNCSYQLNHNFSFKNLKFKIKPKSYFEFWKFLKDEFDGEDYVFIIEDFSYNPNFESYPLEKIFEENLSPYNDYVLFYKTWKQLLEMSIWYNFYSHCKGLVRYDFNNNTFNMVNSINWRYNNLNLATWSLPTIFINGTIGKDIINDPKNHTIDFYLNQTYNESIISYNVIGQLNGTDENKIVIIDCLYDSWWCQGTGDSAIGMAMVLGIAKYFKDNNISPKYTIRFIGFGGEEQGAKGAKHYQAVHKNEEIIFVFDLNQLGFSQDYPELHLDLISNDIGFLNDIFELAKRSDYSNRTGNAGIRKFCSSYGAPSDDRPFAQNQPDCKTICFLKGVDWILHHRDGLNHTEGDVMKYLDPNDVNVTGEVILNVVKYFTTEW